MNKAEIVEAVLELLQAEFENFCNVSKRTRATGADSETRAEDKYDTRSTEENYLADGLARQAVVCAEAAAAFNQMTLLNFHALSPINVSALVQLDFGGEAEWFLIGPARGGIEVEHEGVTVTVLTPESPLGSQLMGRKVGDLLISPKSRILAVE